MRSEKTRATAYLGLGSNLGERLGALRAAVGALDGYPAVSVDLAQGIASLYETSPVGGPPDQPTYLNSVVRVTTTLAPLALLDAALEVEASLGRVRLQHWGPRVIDIDLLLYEDVIFNDTRLTLPHAHLHERRFVLEPLAEIAGEVVHPVLHVTIERLLRELPASGSADTVVRVAGRDWCRISQPAGDSSGMYPARGDAVGLN